MSNVNKNNRRAKTPTTQLEVLWQQGYFAQSHSYAEIVAAFAEMGCHFRQSAVSMALKRARHLTPLGKGKTARYIQAYPFED